MGEKRQVYSAEEFKVVYVALLLKEAEHNFLPFKYGMYIVTSFQRGQYGETTASTRCSSLINTDKLIVGSLDSL